MKKITNHGNKILVSFILITSMLVSCKKFIEIPPPPTSITQTEQFADSTTAMGAIVGVYNYNPSTGFAYADGNINACAGQSADEISYTTTNDIQQFYTYTLTGLNSTIPTLWSSPYKGLYQVNVVINSIDGNTNLSPSFQKQITGEMKVVRALYYFNLVNLFGDVPLVTTIDYKVNTHIPRTSVATVYKQIVADLTDAAQKLPATYPSAGHLRPNLYTAMSLLAKVHLYQGAWQSAYNEADSVIKLGGYSLEPDVNNVFLDGSKEAIWQLPAKQSYYATADGRNFVPSYSGSVPQYVLTPFQLNAFETGDQRLQKWIGTSVITISGVAKTYKYPYKYKNIAASSTPTEDQMVFRLGELYLIRAEAAAHLNNLQQALTDVNAIRSRAGLTASTADVTSQAAVLAAIMHERQTELCFEWANRWFDLKRTGTAAVVLGAEKTGYTADAALYPIPQSQILLNNLLIQNPGYQ